MQEQKRFLSVITRSEAAKVYISEIIYISSAARKIYIYTESGVHSMYRKMDEVARLLPENFYRCHKSCIINLDKVKNMKNHTIYFECGKELGVGTEKFSKAVQTYRGYLICHEGDTKKYEHL